MSRDVTHLTQIQVCTRATVTVTNIFEVSLHQTHGNSSISFCFWGFWPHTRYQLGELFCLACHSQSVSLQRDPLFLAPLATQAGEAAKALRHQRQRHRSFRGWILCSGQTDYILVSCQAEVRKHLPNPQPKKRASGQPTSTSPNESLQTLSWLEQFREGLHLFFNSCASLVTPATNTNHGRMPSFFLTSNATQMTGLRATTHPTSVPIMMSGKLGHVHAAEIEGVQQTQHSPHALRSLSPGCS